MENQGFGNQPGQINVPEARDQLIGNETAFQQQPVTYQQPMARQFQAPFVAPAPVETIAFARDRVQWGPILAGISTSIALLMIATVLALRVNASLIKPTTPVGAIETWAGIYGTLAVIIAFFVGGWVAARTAAVGGSATGAINGFVVGAASITLIVILTGLGATNLFGLFGAGFRDFLTGTASAATYAAARNAAWWGLAALVLGLVFSTLGGWYGHNTRQEVVEANMPR